METIIEYEKRLKELNLELSKILEEKESIEKKLRSLVTYNTNEITNIIKKLMEAFENIEYEFKSGIDPNTIFISPKERENFPYIHKSYQVIKTNQDISYLPPDIEDNNKDYIITFINYLYDKRKKEKAFQIDSAYLENALKNFLKSSKKQQLERKEEIKKLNAIKEEQRKRKIFEDTCFIDRDLIFKSIIYIANNLENDLKASSKKEKEKIYYNAWVTLNLYHKLIIKKQKQEYIYQTTIDQDGCYPDEEYCGLSVSTKKTKINFFELWRELKVVIENSTYLIEFMKIIEEYFNNGIEIKNKDIEAILANLRNKKNSQKLNRELSK